MTAVNFTCEGCGKSFPVSERMLEGQDWCEPCIAAEGQRNNKQDAAGSMHLFGRRVTTTSRPPKYMLRPEEYEEFGY